MYCAPVMAPAAAPLLGVVPAAVGYFVTVAYFGSMIGAATAGGWGERFVSVRAVAGGAGWCWGPRAGRAGRGGGALCGLGGPPRPPAGGGALPAVLAGA